MNFEQEKSDINKQKKLWQQYLPLYLDYFEQLQMGIQPIDFLWLKSKKNFSPHWDNFQILLHGKDNNKSFLDYITVLYPIDSEEYSPEELIQQNRNIKSIRKHKII